MIETRRVLALSSGLRVPAHAPGLTIKAECVQCVTFEAQRLPGGAGVALQDHGKSLPAPPDYP